MTAGTARRRCAAALAAIGAVVLAPATAAACPQCSLGGREAWTFMLLVVGSFLVGAGLVLAWALASGQFRDPRGVSRRVLELDRETGVQRDE